jgi:hypothetical protein
MRCTNKCFSLISHGTDLESHRQSLDSYFQFFLMPDKSQKNNIDADKNIIQEQINVKQMTYVYED